MLVCVLYIVNRVLLPALLKPQGARGRERGTQRVAHSCPYHEQPSYATDSSSSASSTAHWDVNMMAMVKMRDCDVAIPRCGDALEQLQLCLCGQDGQYVLQRAVAEDELPQILAFASGEREITDITDITDITETEEGGS